MLLPSYKCYLPLRGLSYEWNNRIKFFRSRGFYNRKKNFNIKHSSNSKNLLYYVLTIDIECVIHKHWGLLRWSSLESNSKGKVKRNYTHKHIALKVKRKTCKWDWYSILCQKQIRKQNKMKPVFVDHKFL